MPIKKTYVAIGVVVIVIVLALLYKKFMKKSSEYAIPPTTTSDTNTTRQQTYANNLITCETQYINDMNTAGDDTTAQATANTRVNNCISSNVVSYYNARCPFLPQGTGTTNVLSSNPTTLLNGSSNVAYVAYKADIDAINAVYTPLISAAGQTASTIVIQAARKADFTGATRKYFATLCPDLYSNSTSSALQTTYTGWTRSSTAAYGWDSARVTLANIWEWAKYAGQPPGTDNGNYTAPAKPLLSTPNFLSECSGGYFTATTNGIPNWQIAADNGPGTRNSAFTSFPWTPADATKCPAVTGTGSSATGTFIATATAANPLP